MSEWIKPGDVVNYVYAMPGPDVTQLRITRVDGDVAYGDDITGMSATDVDVRLGDRRDLPPHRTRCGTWWFAKEAATPTRS